MDYVVSQQTVAERPTAVIAAETTWEAFPSLWRQLLDEIWEVVRSNDAIVPGRNVMLYKDDVPNVEIGVGSRSPSVQAPQSPPIKPCAWLFLLAQCALAIVAVASRSRFTVR